MQAPCSHGIVDVHVKLYKILWIGLAVYLRTQQSVKSVLVVLKMGRDM